MSQSANISNHIPDTDPVRSAEALWDIVSKAPPVEAAKAFEQLHRLLFEPLFAYAWKWTENKALAADAIQDLFIRMWEKRMQTGPIRQVKAYFFRALRTTIINQFKAASRNRLGFPEKLPEPEWAFSPEEIFIHEEKNQHLQQSIVQMLNQLPPRQREAVYLRYFEDLDYRQIASVMGVNPQSVANFLHKAIHHLKQGGITVLLFSFASL